MNSDPKTTAEHLTELNQLVRWTLWKIATTDPGLDEPLRDYSVGESFCIQGHAKDLFNDPHWVANVVGEFVACRASGISTVGWVAFKEKIDG